MPTFLPLEYSTSLQTNDTKICVYYVMNTDEFQTITFKQAAHYCYSHRDQACTNYYLRVPDIHLNRKTLSTCTTPTSYHERYY